jgi:hypothetical protein
MTSIKTRCISFTLFSLVLVGVPSPASAQQASGELNLQGAVLGPVAPGYDVNREANIQAYVDLLRSDVRSQKTQVLSQVMDLSASDAAKFWPIYSEYEAELSKIGDGRVAIIQEYVDNYGTLTDEQADRMVNGVIDLRIEGLELMRKYYERVKAEMGAIPAARFLQVENQLMLLTNLQIASSLPAVD